MERWKFLYTISYSMETYAIYMVNDLIDCDRDIYRITAIIFFTNT